MAIKDRLRSALTPNSRSPHSSTLSASSYLTKTSTTSSSTKSSTSSNTSNSSSSASRISNLFRPRRSNPSTEEEAWVDPPLKYSDPPQQEYVDLLAAWDWNTASNHTFSMHHPTPGSGYGYGYGVNVWNGANARYDARYGYGNAAFAAADRRLEKAAGRVVLTRQRSWDSCVSPGTTSRRGSESWDWI